MKRIAWLMALISISISANALIIDNNTYTTDTESGLDWLDVTTTTNQTFTYVSGQLGAGGLYEGWRYATRTELHTLISNAGTTPVTGTGLTVLSESNGFSSADLLTDLLGSTYDTWSFDEYGESYDSYLGFAEGEGLDVTWGFYVSGINNELLSTAIIWDCDAAGVCSPDQQDVFFDYSEELVNDNYSPNYLFGSYLVRDTLHVSSVPEPSTFALLGLGLFGLGLTRRKRV